ncbi:MAG: hypothetical protein ACHP7H_00415 [Hyphomicrobiales bacterium]
MLDTLSPESYLSQQYHQDAERLTDNQIAAVRALREHVWNSLVPACALSAEIIPHKGVRYLHPTKGYRYVGKRRFAARGVL